MSRAIWFLIKLAIVVAIAIYFVEHPGSVTIDWMGYAINTSFAILLVVIVALVGVAALGYRLWRGLRGAPGMMGRRSRARKRERGYRALTRGMVAVAAGDAAGARRYAREADTMLRDPPLTMLLSAQAAQLNGDEKAAEHYFQTMLERPETAFLGVRGLLTQAIRDGNQTEALQLARRAKSLQPQTPWVLTTLFDLETRAAQWGRAEQTLLDGIKSGAFPAEAGRHHRAALLLERSYESELEGHHDDALRYAQSAAKLEPSFPPAASRLARLLARTGKHRKGAKVIEKAWTARPHPELADAYRDISQDSDPLAQVKRFERLQSLAPNNLDGHVALARAAMSAKLWGEARNHLSKALAERPSDKIYRMLAELAEAEHGDIAAARDWLAKAANAEPDPIWVCKECGTLSKSWRSLCGQCGAFDSMDWKQPSVAVQIAEPNRLPPAATPQPPAPPPPTTTVVSDVTPPGQGSPAQGSTTSQPQPATS
ncbi:enzyme of heme biosynthesis (hemY-like) [Skermanella stibiiresistens SB22]|uniref:Enzyme of heme biosynthesis (HemY-like) n=1 Tax=Skermanella stibiiresistens SB22 TaxID=1385369 RepID=W9H9L4_9PROT|nr:heme biosynthesis HemY N-terminal domain-containing protein [Skermanella stibiiresistens]EWY40528.1 enzyme of heme biosynthesis (hemY-like) [Skermanella stibiiresistens SB22]